MAIDTTALYCCVGGFCTVFEDWEVHQLIPSEQTRKRSGKLSRSEMLFIMVLFHLSAFKNFKTFYLSGIGQQHRTCFLKSEMGLEPTRHRSVINAMVHV